MNENTNVSKQTIDENRFSSLTLLRNAHSKMLTLHREKGNEPEIIAKIEQLINKGRATGALLDNEDDRWAAQSLLDYWNSLLYRAGYEPPDAILIEENKAVIQNTFLQSESLEVDWDWGMRLLKHKQLPEIRKRLTDILGRDRILMDVSIEERQRWVNRSLLTADRTLQVDGKDYGTLDANKMLIETFGRDDIEKKLLILGAPGAGKTTALLSLAAQLVEGAISQPRTVIPVIFELSTWRNDNQSIESWLIEQLYDLHGGNRKSKLYEQWLEQQVLLPLLDGLDELGLERQKKCTEKLNEFAERYPHLVVCCRIKEFETVDIKLRHLRGAVCLQSLSDSQIQHYFDSLQRPELWKEIQTTPSLQAMLKPTREGDPGLLRVPLFVKLVADVYDPKQPISGKIDLLDKYIDRQLLFDKREIDHRIELNKYNWAYKTVKIEPDRKKTRNHLSWIAQNLLANNSGEFLVHQIQPSSISTQKQHRYRLINCLINGLAFGLAFLLFWLIFGLFNRLGSNLAWLNFSLIYGLSGLIFGLLTGLFTSLRIQLHPSKSIWKSLQIWTWKITIVLIFVILVFTTFHLFEYWKLGLFSVFVLILLVSDSEAYLQHLSLRIVLWQSGLPWNFTRFLNYCVERRLLMRVGGSYRFLHRELLDHFAQRSR
jgi:NACHT domain